MSSRDEMELDALSPDQRAALDALAGSLSPGQGLLVARWLLARFDAVALAEDRLDVVAGVVKPRPQGLTVLYGSHSGHSASIAQQLASKARKQGWAVKVADMAEYARGNLKREQNLAVIISTHGEGQPPESATPFFDFLQGSRAPQLAGCGFAVLALGDKSYVQFCKAGVDVDLRLESLSAERLLTRVDLDVDYQEGAEGWVDQALGAFAPRMVASKGDDAIAVAPQKTRFSRDNPWMAELLQRATLSGRGSTQHFVHLELSLEGSNIKYNPGDALGLRPENDPLLVDEMISALGHGPQTEVRLADAPCTLVDALTRRLEIGRISPSALRKYAALGAHNLVELVDSPEATTAYLNGRDWLDVLREHPAHIRATDFVALLPELASRSYSIASCQLEYPDEVHLLVSRADYEAHGRARHGIASSYVANRLNVGDKLPLWLEPNTQFRLPEDPNQPIVLIGAGTGIAPFRAFLQSRAATGASGKNWVIFGNRQFRVDFTYQTEWLHWRTLGLLTRMDVAFSRDQEQKLYVTDRLRERAHDLYDWLEQGARIYLCGDRTRLAAGVDRALVEIVMKAGGKSHEQALGYVEQLRTGSRYLKDVY
jgi:sulfite reductase (NADPH) flavoprotein alpha-component